MHTKVYLQISSQEKADEIALKVKELTALHVDKELIDEAPVALPGLPGFFVTSVDTLDISAYSADIISSMELRPDLAAFASGLQENYDREEDGRIVVKELITMLDGGLGGSPQSAIAGLFKEMGWVRSMLKEGFFETAYYEHTVVFTPKGLLPPESLEALRLKILELAKKYNSDFDGTVS